MASHSTTITIIDRHGEIRRETTRGYCYGVMAVTPNHNERGWTLTHIPSGLSLGVTAPCAQLKRIAWQLAEIDLPNDGHWVTPAQHEEACRRLHLAWYSVYQRSCQRCHHSPAVARVTRAHIQSLTCGACRTSEDEYVTPTTAGQSQN